MPLQLLLDPRPSEELKPGILHMINRSTNLMQALPYLGNS